MTAPPDLHRYAAWLIKASPDTSVWVPKVDRRCWETLRAFTGLSKLVTHGFPNLGIYPDGNGVKVLWWGSISEPYLTRLVDAGRKTGCSVTVGPAEVYGVRVPDLSLNTVGDFEDVDRLDFIIDADDPPDDWYPERRETEPLLISVCRAPAGILLVTGEWTECDRTVVRATLDSPWVHDDSIEHPHFHNEGTEGPPHDPDPAPLWVHPIDNGLWVGVEPRESH